MLKLPKPEVVQRLAALCEITSQDTLAPSAFSPNDEQRKLLSHLAQNQLLIVLKSRQIGASTIICLYDLCVAIANPGINIAIVADKAENAKGLLSKCAGFARDLCPQQVIGESKSLLTLANGSTVTAVTAAGGSKKSTSGSGRSKTYHYLHVTELAYWANQNALTSILAAAPGAPVVIESTAKGQHNLFAKLYNGHNNYKKVFFSVEDHAAYRDDPASISDEVWEEARNLGFTKRECAAWWYAKLLSSGADIAEHKKEYPVSDKDPFKSSSTSFIQAIPDIVPYTMQDNFKVYHQAKLKTVMSVDVSSGSGRDYSVITVIEEHTKRLIASWIYNDKPMTELAEAIKAGVKLFGPREVLVEKNGLGIGLVEMLSVRGVKHHAIVTTANTKSLGLVAAKQHIENGSIYGPEDLVDECQSLHVDDFGRFAGRKDICMSLGFALLWLKNNETPAKNIINKQTTFVQPTFKKQQRLY